MNQLYGKIPFTKFRLIAAMLSAVLIVGSLVSLTVRGLEFGIDFTGGVLVELGYQTPTQLQPLREALKQQQDFGDFEVAHLSSDREVLIRIAPNTEISNAQLGEKVIGLARSLQSDVDVRRVEFVGPKVGEELTTDGGLAMLYALLGILIYISFRFEWRLALGSVIALAHDVIITLGFFSLFAISVDLTVLAAVLAIIGYSLNDTIVVFDRIRENFINLRKGSAEEVTNKSLNDMLARTLMTSLTTLFVVIALFVVGGEIIHNFSIALLIGVIVGTYSSIYVASSTVLALGIDKKHLMPPEKEHGAESNSHTQMLSQQLQQQRTPTTPKKTTRRRR